MAYWRYMATWIYVTIGSGNATTWTNVDLSSVRSSGIYQRAISQETPQPLIIKVNLKINDLKSYSNLPGANELSGRRRMKELKMATN